MSTSAESPEFVTEVAADGTGSIRVKDLDAHIDFRLDREARTMDIYHTFVGPSLRGKGMAGKVAAQAFAYAKAEGLKVIPTCSYISGAFLDRNPELRDLVAREGGL
mmetsp:Transcript_27588/g.88721  ORF Transcript_27588/g.88721 Transcript_27588/m.88721 type:complete len:106 (-) Transcript_27588:56-373(-)